MNRKGLIISGSIVLLLGIVGLFVFKVFGSNELENVSKCTPFNVEVSKGQQEYSVNIAWKTKEVCSGFITYGEGEDELDLVSVDIQNGVKSNTHIVTLYSLVSTKTYYFSIISDSVNYGKNGLPILITPNSL